LLLEMRKWGIDSLDVPIRADINESFYILYSERFGDYKYTKIKNFKLKGVAYGLNIKRTN
jgi:hypothetical protein